MEENNNKTVTKTLRMPPDIVKKIEKDAEEQQRDFTKQVIYIIKKYYQIKE